MRARLLLFCKLFLFWMFFMLVARFTFLIYNHDYSLQLTLQEVIQAQGFGMLMDMSVTGCIMVLLGLLITASCLIHGRWLYYTLNTISFCLLAVAVVLVMVDVELYRHWDFRLNDTPLFYMGSEAVGSVNTWVAIKVIVTGTVLGFLFYRLYMRWIATASWNLTPALKKSSIVLLAITASMFLFMRGSFTTAKMNTGFVYFHPTKMYANHAAINVVWNFTMSVGSTSHVEYPEDFYDQQLTEKYFATLAQPHDSTFSILKNNQPNVILVLVESFTARIIEPFGGLKGITPRFNELSKEGILFDNFYASATRTDKGLVSILSAYPSQPNSIIIKYPKKIQTLPSLNKSMRALGYNSSFVYGGDADFAYFRSYLMASSFEALTDVEAFDSELNSSKWGVHDGFVLMRALQELDTTSAPYFKVILTQSSHEPFDVPMKPLLPPTSEENLFLNACHYTDSCLGAFVDRLKKREDWGNTLVILTADHGHRFPGNKKVEDKKRFHIPLLLLGGAVKTDSVIHTVGNQTDIANTLLAQLDKADTSFTFSRNLFGNNLLQHSAYYYTDGYGFIMPGKFLVWDNTAKKFVREENADEHMKALSKAYQQKLYSDFNKR
jgi:phosphoglycerol transferase MdoB-like AlkP superfamily enzyme